MGIRDFAISTNHPFNKYKPGQTVQGKVHFKLSEPKKVRGVYIKAKGKATVEFHETQTSGKLTRSVRYFSEHEYFNERLYFSGSHDGNSYELAAGEHNYKFEYTLPLGLPSTYSGIYGRIVYKLKAILDIPLAFDDEEEVILDIRSPIDLNSMPLLKRSGRRTEEKNLYCLCCASGPISIQVYIPKTGFTHGEEIPVKIDVENQTGMEVVKVYCKLKQNVTFHSTYPSHRTRHKDTTLSEKTLKGVAGRSTEIYEEILGVPLTPPINFTNCNILEVDYKLKVTACISGLHHDLDVEIPITLGSIRIRDDNEVQQPVSIFAGLGTPYTHDGRGDTAGTSAKLIDTSAGWRIPQEKNGSGSST